MELRRMSTKTCIKCKLAKDLESFTNNRTKNDGKNNYCKLCQSIYRQQHNSKIKNYLKKYRKKHKKRLNDLYKTYRTNNKEKIRKRDLEYREKNQIKIKRYHRQWRKKNKQVINQKKRKHYHTRKQDINYRLLNNLRARIRIAIKGGKKCLGTAGLLGCSIETARIHIEKQFKDGMSWDNYGLYGWHIDHIIPCDKFDLSKEKEQKKCFHYTNLQPLWAKDNIKKSNKTIY